MYSAYDSILYHLRYIPLVVISHTHVPRAQADIGDYRVLSAERFDL